jgi:hypothetical protein
MLRELYRFVAVLTLFIVMLVTTWPVPESPTM